MNNLFTSESGLFSLNLPVDWEEYDDEETESTYAFFNTKRWTGNFRITHFRQNEITNLIGDNLANFLEKQIQGKEGAIKVKLGDFICAFFKEKVTQDEDKFVIYYWMAGIKNNIFYCSFTINEEQENTEQNKVELNIVQDIIRSIKLLN